MASLSVRPAPISRTSSVSRVLGSSLTTTSRVRISAGASKIPGPQRDLRKLSPLSAAVGRPAEMIHCMGTGGRGFRRRSSRQKNRCFMKQSATCSPDGVR